MLTRVFNQRPINITFTLLIILGAIICIYTPNYLFIKIGTRFAGIFMLSYLALGLFFLVIKQPGLMMTSFICCAGLCIFLKNSSNSTLLHPIKTIGQVVNVAHFNMTSADDDLEAAVETILESNADLISVQDVTPEWKYLLNETLHEEYPYNTTIERLDPFGLAVYSKYPLISIDTFFSEGVPNLHGKLKMDEKELDFFAVHTTPPLYNTAYTSMKKQISQLSGLTKLVENPVLIMGNFHAPPWWSEIQNFRSEANLEDSRISAAIGISDIFQSPTDYILFSDQIKCVGFQNIYAPNQAQFGIQGSYQINRKRKNAESTF